MKIGLILSQPPVLSETFFNSKIKGLLANDFEVVLFVQKKNSSFSLCPVKEALPMYKKNFLGFLGGLIRFFWKCFKNTNRSKKFIYLQRKDGISRFQSIKNLYSSSHIIDDKLDWLHFGFATMAINKEHLAKAMNAKMAISCRGYDMDVFPLKVQLVYKHLWPHVDKVHTISRYMLEKAYENGMYRYTEFQIITPAIDTKQFSIDKALSFIPPLNIITIARLHWIKGLHDTIEALAILKHRGLDFSYTIVGMGPEYEPLKFAVHQLNLADSVIFFGEMEKDGIKEILSKTDLYIQYSLSEGFCNAVLEAQAMGCLCVVSDGGALPENIINGQTGWVVPKNNPKLLADALMKVIYLPDEQKKQIIQNAQDRVRQEFNLDLQSEQFATFYNS